MNKLGVYLAQDKQDAILHGDTNSLVIRNLMDGIQMMGMYLSAPEETPAMVLLQARYLQRAWESLIQLTQTSQERDKTRALVIVAHGFIVLRLNAAAQLYFLKACKIIEKEKFRFLPEHGRPLEFSERVREEASILSQAIYLENYLYLTLGGPAPVKTAGLEREFKLDLQVRAIHHFSPQHSKPIWLSGLASVPMPIRDMSFNHADSKRPVGQRRYPRSEFSC